MRPRLVLGVGLLLSFLMLGAAPPSFQEVEEALTCQCGCGLTVHSCNHLQCGSALPLREEIRQQLAEGKDKESVIEHFRDKYGEKILSAPTTTGFNLVAWILPFVLVGLGGVFVLVTVRRWGRRGGGGDAGKGPPPVAPGAPTEYQRILERELAQFDH